MRVEGSPRRSLGTARLSWRGELRLAGLTRRNLLLLLSGGLLLLLRFLRLLFFRFGLLSAQTCGEYEGG